MYLCTLDQAPSGPAGAGVDKRPADAVHGCSAVVLVMGPRRRAPLPGPAASPWGNCAASLSHWPGCLRGHFRCAGAAAFPCTSNLRPGRPVPRPCTGCRNGSNRAPCTANKAGAIIPPVCIWRFQPIWVDLRVPTLDEKRWVRSTTACPSPKTRWTRTSRNRPVSTKKTTASCTSAATS